MEREDVRRGESLLREATRDLLPASIVERKKSPYPSTQDPACERALRERLRGLIAAGESPVLGLLDRERVPTVLDTDVGGVSLQSSRSNV